MSLVVTNSAEILLLQYLLNMASPTDQILHLFTNNVTPGESTVIGGLTEATEAGYAVITLTGGSWTTTQNSGVTTGVYSEQTFTFTTGATLYGYYVTDTSGNLLWVERFSGTAFQLPTGGGQIAVTPTITLE
jgi:hypothetical protein